MRKIPNIKLSEVRDLVAQNKSLSGNSELVSILGNMPSWFFLEDIVWALPPTLAISLITQGFSEYKFTSKSDGFYKVMLDKIATMKKEYTADADQKIHDLYHTKSTMRQYGSMNSYRSSVRYITRRVQEDIVDAMFRFESEFVNELCKFIKQGKVY